MRSEFQHNTPDQVRGYIGAALELTDELDPPSDLRADVFRKAVDLLSAKQIMFEQPQPSPLVPQMALRLPN